MTKERRQEDRIPIKLKIMFRSADSLIAEFTRSISHGGLSVESKRYVEKGTEFFFEMHTPKFDKHIEVTGTVKHCTQVDDEQFLVGVHYTFDNEKNRNSLQKLVDQLIEEYQYDYIRRHPRIPMSIKVQDTEHDEPEFIMKDLSLGGCQIAIRDDKRQKAIEPDTDASLFVPSGKNSKIQIDGSIIWKKTLQNEQDTLDNRIGIAFHKTSKNTKAFIESILQLEHLPDIIFIEFHHD